LNRIIPKTTAPLLPHALVIATVTMSGVSNFLAKQKKAELADLAESLGVEYAARIALVSRMHS
jgi:hypothetical protein